MVESSNNKVATTLHLLTFLHCFLIYLLLAEQTKNTFINVFLENLLLILDCSKNFKYAFVNSKRNILVYAKNHFKLFPNHKSLHILATYFNVLFSKKVACEIFVWKIFRYENKVEHLFWFHRKDLVRISN